MKDDYSVVKAVRQCAGRVRFSIGASDVNSDDTITCRFAFTAWGCLLRDLLPTCADPINRFNCFLNGSKRIDLIELARTLKSARALLIRLLSEASWQVPLSVDLNDFKHRLGGECQYLGILTPIKELLVAFFNSPSPETFRPCFQWLSFIERLNLKSLDKTEEYCLSYELYEDELKRQTYPNKVVSDLEEIMAEYTAGFSLEGFDPCFGPGAVAESTGRRNGSIVKFQLGHVDPLLRYFRLHLPDGMIPHDIFPDVRFNPSDRTNVIVFVPKSVEKNRIISKEPAALGWYQHGVARALDKMIQECPILRRRVNLHDQAASRDAAWSGSLFGEYATLDLSNASDSVSLTLIKRIIRNTSLRRALICTRSRYASLPNGKVLSLEKFAPMGSAVCFPIETLIFAGCCELAVRRESGRKSQDYDFVVYGDDIVIKSCYVTALLEILRDLRFEVNQDKSYWQIHEMNFREACGEYFVNGQSVRPLRLSRGLALTAKPDKSRIVGIRASLVSLSNEAFRYGYACLRSSVLCQLREYFPKFSGLVFTDDENYSSPDKIITWPGGCTNYNLRARHDLGERRPYFGSSAYHISVVYTYPDKSLIKKHGLESIDDYSKLYLWWRKRLHEDLLRGSRQDSDEIRRPTEGDSDPLRSEQGWRWAYIN